MARHETTLQSVAHNSGRSFTSLMNYFEDDYVIVRSHESDVALIQSASMREATSTALSSAAERPIR